MGMASSQARLLNLTARMHQIEYKAAKLEAMKLQMANESTRVYEDYLNTLEATKIQYKTLTDDAAVTYQDATYFDLFLNDAAPEQYGLFSIENGHMFVPEYIKEVYDRSGNADDFASELSGYTPPNPHPASYDISNDTHHDVIPDGEEVAKGNDIEMYMKDKKYTTVTPDGITLTIKDTFSGGDYKYTISSTEDTLVNFKYLDNGRLVIEGDGLTISEVNSGQNDDIILLGHSNVLNTGGGDDTIRVGTCLDSSKYTLQSNNNIINTGTGNDHVTVFGVDNNIYKNSQSDSGFSSGADTLLYVPTSNTDLSGQNTTDINKVYTGMKNNANNGTKDGKDGWACQGDDGDCRLLALINSLAHHSNNATMDYVNISNPDASGNYTVTFPKYNNNQGVTTTVSKSEINSFTGVYGDLDTVITDIAINKLIAADDTLEGKGVNGRNTSVSTADWNVLSNYIFGNTQVGMIQNIGDTGFNYFSKQCNKYLHPLNPANTEYTNMLVSFKTTHRGLGIISGHAYSVKDLNDNYIELVNPWDDKDSLKLSIDTFKKYAENAFTFGKNIGGNITITNVGSEVSPVATPKSTNIKGVSANLQREKYNYYVNMYNAIKAAGGCEIIPDDMIYNKNWLTNIINGGFAYIKMIHNGDWVDTSVATNTSLQEVQDKTLLKKAEAKYEADMKRIDMKDRKYDSDLAALETERNAIKQEIETLKTVAKDNVERTFKLFS